MDSCKLPLFSGMIASALNCCTISPPTGVLFRKYFHVPISYWMVYWLVLCQLDTGWSYHRERSFSWGSASRRSSCKAFSQLVMGGGRPPCGWCHFWAGSLGSVREQAEQAGGSKPVKNIPPWPLHQLLLPDLLEFQSWLPLMMNRNMESVIWINPFIPNFFLGHDVLYRNRNHY